ncbi:MAG: hypothetical protein Kow0081_5090 [Candidatus Dojkabacteria bacterium]
MPNQNDPRLQQILVQLAPFGFRFYGFDENSQPLVIGPNKQVTHINVAIQFVNQQIENQQSSGSPESMPDIPNMPIASPERSAETKIETAIESAVETKQEEETENQNNQKQGPQVQVPQKAPTIKLERPKIIPYGDGFEPKSFNPESISQTLKYIEKHSKASKTSSNKWLAEQFRKFVKEIQEGIISKK